MGGSLLQMKQTIHYIESKKKKTQYNILHHPDPLHMWSHSTFGNIGDSRRNMNGKLDGTTLARNA